MHVNVFEKLRRAEPAAARGRIHHLHEPTVPAPHHHEVSKSRGELDDDERGERVGLGAQQMIQGQHDLLGIEA